MKEINLNKFFELLKGKWHFAFIFLGVIILLFSFFGGGEETTAYIKENVTSEQYIKETEEKLNEIISEIIGSNNVKVMITLDSSIENIYADSTKTDTQVKENGENSNSNKTEQSNKVEEEYIIVKDSDGNETALTVAQIMPRIRGVLVVCDGGNETVIRDIVKNAVVTVLDINSKKVCVVGGLN